VYPALVSASDPKVSALNQIIIVYEFGIFIEEGRTIA
jgi:hypothetical protein